MRYVLTENGKENVRSYIRELEAKRKEILDAGKDTADETDLPTEEDIVSDIEIDWDDPNGPCYYNGWGVTDNYDADRPILLKLGRDLIITDHVPGAVFLYKQYRDDYAYGEEKIMVFPDRETAEEKLKADVEEYFGMEWAALPEAIPISKDDTFRPDYVSVYLDGKDATAHWVIEEHSVEKEGKNRKTNRTVSPFPGNRHTDEEHAYVLFRVNGRFTAEVPFKNGPDIDGMIRDASEAYISADFGELKDIDAEAVCIEDSSGNRLWVK